MGEPFELAGIKDASGHSIAGAFRTAKNVAKSVVWPVAERRLTSSRAFLHFDPATLDSRSRGGIDRHDNAVDRSPKFRRHAWQEKPIRFDAEML
jgi:hypothetical protein